MRGMEDCEFCVLCCVHIFSLETTRAAVLLNADG